MINSKKEHVGESSTCQKSLEWQIQYYRLTAEQIQILEGFFNECSHPNENQLDQLSRKIGLDPKKIMVWFQNKRTQTEHERIFNSIPSVLGRPFVMESNLAPPKSSLGSSSNSSNDRWLNQNICGSPTAFHHDNREKSIIFGMIVPAMNEMIEYLQLNNSIWGESLSAGVEFIMDREGYDKIFPNPNRPSKSPSTQFESSRVSGVVSMNAIELIQHFLDLIKWMNLFSTIVTIARTIEVLDTGYFGGSMQLMYEKLHILSPLVEARDYFFIRHCRKLDQTTWIMVDVSYDLIKEIQSGEVSHAWKFPSGCAIRDMDNGESMVIWIEHIQVDEKIRVHDMFQHLLYGRETYGAKRWIVTLQRMAERYNVEVGATCLSRHDLKVINNLEGLDSIMQISLRMVKRFCEILSMLDKVDYPTSSHLNSEDKISIRKK